MSVRNYKVMFIVTSLALGGLETYLVNVIERMCRERFSISVVYTGAKDEWYVEKLTSMGVRVVACYNSYFQLPFIFHVRKLMKVLEVDIVCDFRNDFSGTALLAARTLNVPVRAAMYRSSRHSFESTFLKRMYVQVNHAITEMCATRIVANSKAVLNKFYPGWANSNRFRVVYNGVDLKRFRPAAPDDALRTMLGVPQDCKVIGHVGSFRIAKNHKTLLEVFRRIRMVFCDSRLLLIGDGPLRGEIERQAKRLGIADATLFVGNRRDTPALLNLMDVFLFPSAYEGMPNALVEAMACERPFVASRIPEIAEILCADLQDQLCCPCDVEGQTEKVLNILRNRGSATRIAKRARKHVENEFDIESSTKSFVSVLIERYESINRT